MNSTKQAALRRSALWLNGALALAFIACHAEPARSQQWVTNGNNISNTNTGNVGIGTATPVTTLHIRDAAHATINLEAAAGAYDGALLFQRGGVNQWFLQARNSGAPLDSFALFDAVNGVFRLTVNRNGNVGIGATNPNYRMVVGPEMQSGMIYAAMTVSKGANTSSSIVVGAGGTNNVEFGWDHPNTRAFFNAPGTSTMAFVQNGSNVRMFIDGAGNVGIANGIIPLAAANKLTVDGNVHVTGNIAAKYQDVAEWVPTREKLAAGTVVVLDTTASNHVVASTAAYDTGVAGVVSEQPGIILGEAGEGKVKVATTGRVKVRVDATRAPVRIGDLLVTGDGPGVAMRSEPVAVGGRRLHAPGTIVGKALEPLEKGVGEILVLLSLQ